MAIKLYSLTLDNKQIIKQINKASRQIKLRGFPYQQK